MFRKRRATVLTCRGTLRAWRQIRGRAEILGGCLSRDFLPVVGCWSIASAILDYETPKSFNILYCLAVLAPLAAVYHAWTFGFDRFIQARKTWMQASRGCGAARPHQLQRNV